MAERATVRAAYAQWPHYDARLREVVGRMTEEQLALRPGPKRWPIWATVGHTACQRVFWLSDFAGIPGADETPFIDATHDCPGDDDLEHALDAPSLVAGLASSFRIVERCLDTWTIESLEEVIERPDFGPDWVHTRGSVLQRVFSHDLYHCGELSLALDLLGLPQIDPWDGGADHEDGSTPA